MSNISCQKKTLETYVICYKAVCIFVGENNNPFTGNK